MRPRRRPPSFRRPEPGSLRLRRLEHPRERVLLRPHLLQVQLPVRQSRTLFRRQHVHDERPVRPGGPLQPGHGRGERHRLRRSGLLRVRPTRHLRRRGNVQPESRRRRNHLRPAARRRVRRPGPLRRCRACVPQSTPAGTPAPTQCNDGNACTADQCDGSGGCQHPGTPGRTPCGDPASSQCDLPDTCNGTGSCLVNHVANGTACNDGRFCTVTDSCQGGACVGSGDPCAGRPLCQNVCNETTHDCLVPVGGSCDDGNACNGTATCNAVGACIPGTPLPDGSSCDDHNPCTLLDTCTGQQCDGGPPCVARRKAKLNNVAAINADLAAWDVAGAVTIGKNGFMPDATSVTGNKVKLGGGTSVFDVLANILGGKGAVIRGTTGAVVLPLTS